MKHCVNLGGVYGYMVGIYFCRFVNCHVVVTYQYVVPVSALSTSS